MAKRFRLPIQRSPRSDPQQYLVYRMENEAIGARNYQQLTRARVGLVVRSICLSYAVPCPRLVWKDLGKWGAEWSVNEKGVSTISLNLRKGTARDMITVTHELAHHLHCWLGGKATEKQQSHGPEFMACHMSILDTVRMIPVAAMRVICDKYKIRYADPGERNSLTALKRAIRGRNRSPA